MSIPHIYVPKKKTKIKDFYEELEEIYNKLNKRNIRMVIGAGNANIGREPIYKHISREKSKHQT